VKPAGDSRGLVAELLRCETPGCGQQLAGSGAAAGWVLVRVVGSGDPPRRYCCGTCAGRGIARVELGHHRPEPAPQTAGPPARRGGNPSPPNNSRLSADRVAALGVTPDQIRSWARAHNLFVRSRGALPAHVLDAYEQAHRAPA